MTVGEAHHPHETGPEAGPEYDDSVETPVRSVFAPTDEDLVSPLTLVLVRHGVTKMTVSHQLSGSGVPGPPLNSAGRIQAAKAADAVYRIGRSTWERVPQISRVFASPMTRTQETGAALGRRLGLHVETDARVREVDFGEWEGLTADEVGERYGDQIHRWRFGELAPAGGESIPEVGARFDEFMKEVAAEHARQSAAGNDVPRAWAVATHAVAIKSAVAVSLAMPTSHWGQIWPLPASLTILQLRVRNDGSIAERHIFCVGAPTD